ncbi:FkbM family methyltransferase [Catalinimonas sp. 4WD22]|uniref:FkbM family methyltransferase n=1 Tax=Catalinimonas locisalis TaxID=3133978 RepID=UPI003100E216
MLPAFKESFLDDIYLRGFPQSVLKKKNLKVIDIGANVGFFSLYMFYQFLNARVLAFEPIPYNFGVLEQYQKRFKDFDFHIFPKAVGGKNEKITLNASKLDGYTTMASVFESSKKGHQIEVEALSLDTVFDQHQLKQIDLLKLDCEGAEYDIIYNASEETLNNISMMSIETHQGVQKDENLQSLQVFLKKKGFQLSALDEGNTGYLWAWKV